MAPLLPCVGRMSNGVHFADLDFVEHSLLSWGGFLTAQCIVAYSDLCFVVSAVKYSTLTDLRSVGAGLNVKIWVLPNREQNTDRWACSPPKWMRLNTVGLGDSETQGRVCLPSLVFHSVAHSLGVLVCARSCITGCHVLKEVLPSQSRSHWWLRTAKRHLQCYQSCLLNPPICVGSGYDWFEHYLQMSCHV